MTDRAVSEVLSYTLVFTLIVGAVLLISLSGVASLEDTRDAEQLNNAERAFDVLHSNIADLYDRGAPSRVTEISLGDAQLYTGNTTTINVTWNDTTTANVSSTSIQFRPLVYDDGQGREIVYEGGAVFRTSRDGGIRLYDPPMVFNGSTILLSLVDTNSEEVQSIGGSTAGIRVNYPRAILSVRSTTVQGFNVTIDSTSQRSELWKKYFEENNFNCGISGSEVTCEYNQTDLDRFYIVAHDLRIELNP